MATQPAIVRLSRVKLGKVPVARPVSPLLTAKQANRNTNLITKTLPPFLHQPAEFQPVQPGSIREVVMHGLFDQRLRLLSSRELAEMHDEVDRFVYRKLPDPAQDEFFGVMVEVPSWKGEWSIVLKS